MIVVVLRYWCRLRIEGDETGSARCCRRATSAPCTLITITTPLAVNRAHSIFIIGIERASSPAFACAPEFRASHNKPTYSSPRTLAPNLQTDYSPRFESFHPNATINTQVRQTNRRDETHHYHRHPLFRHHRHGRSWSCKYTSPQRWPAYALPREPTTALDSPLLELPQALLRKRQRHHLRGPCDRRRLKGLHRVPLLCEFTILIRFLSGPVRLRTAIEKRRGGG
jgi:hypothetical protein